MGKPVIIVRPILMLTVLLFSTACLAEDEDDKDKPFVSARVLTTGLATEIASKAEEFCRKKGYQVSAAVVDRYGNLLAFARDPLSGTHTILVSQYKAYTAASLQSDTISIQGRVNFLNGMPNIAVLGGGIPVRVAGYMYGAVGVSGAPSEKVPGEIDDECARAGIDAVKDVLEFDG